MPGSLNKVQLIGNLGKDPEVRYTNDNRAIANLTIATSENWKDQSGQRQERTEWHRVVLFGPLAEVAEKYLKKGDSAYFEGKLQTRKWQGQDGQDRYTTEVVVDRGGSMQMLGGKSGGASTGGGYGQSAPADNFDQSTPSGGAMKNASSGGSNEAFDDDIPF